MTINPIRLVAWLVAFQGLVFAQEASRPGGYLGIQPGHSVKSDVERTFGKPVRNLSASLVEYSPSKDASNVLVRYREGSAVVEMLQVVLREPAKRERLIELLKLPSQPVKSALNAEGRLDEYFASKRFVVLTHQTNQKESAITQVTYYSDRLFGNAATGARQTAGAAPSVSWHVTEGNVSTDDLGVLRQKGFEVENNLSLSHNATPFLTFGMKKASAGDCQEACARDSSCRAYTYVRPGGELAGMPGICRLYSSPGPRSRHACCVSGFKK